MLTQLSGHLLAVWKGIVEYNSKTGMYWKDTTTRSKDATNSQRRGETILVYGRLLTERKSEPGWRELILESTYIRVLGNRTEYIFYEDCELDGCGNNHITSCSSCSCDERFVVDQDLLLSVFHPQGRSASSYWPKMLLKFSQCACS